MIINAVGSPRYVGSNSTFFTRYEYFYHYMSHYEIVGSATKSIYGNNFRSQIQSYLNAASSNRNDLSKLELSVEKDLEKFGDKPINITGFLAKKDAAIYTMDALIFSKREMLPKLNRALYEG